MPSASSQNSLFVLNFITGVSDGLVLPFVAGLLAYPHFAEKPFTTAGISFLVTIIGALAYGTARYFGEREEIKHNHPQLVLHEMQKESQLMNAIGIDAELTRDMQAQMEQEREMWLNEVEENNMGWERYDEQRAMKSGLQTAVGFFAGGLMVSLPFCFQYNDILQLIFPSLFYLLLLFLFGWIKGKILGLKPAEKAIYLASKGFVILILTLTVLAFIGVASDKSPEEQEAKMTDITP